MYIYLIIHVHYIHINDINMNINQFNHSEMHLCSLYTFKCFCNILQYEQKQNIGELILLVVTNVLQYNS